MMISRRLFLEVLGSFSASVAVMDAGFWPEFITKEEDVRVYPDGDLFVTVRGYVNGPASIERFIVMPDVGKKKLAYVRQIRIVRPEKYAVVIQAAVHSYGIYNWGAVYPVIALPPYNRIELKVHPDKSETLMFYRPLKLSS